MHTRPREAGGEAADAAADPPSIWSADASAALVHNMRYSGARSADAGRIGWRTGILGINSRGTQSGLMGNAA